MTSTLLERRRVARHSRAVAYWCVLLAWLASLLLGDALVPPAWLGSPALLVHLGSVIVGLGATVVLEVGGLMWATGRGQLADVRRTERTVTALAWLGIAGLLASGALLHPDLTSPLTLLKMAAVLLVAMNGVAMTRLTDELHRLPGTVRFGMLPARLRAWCVWSALTSQLAWWTAVIIGMLNSTGG